MKDPTSFNFDGDYGEEYKELASRVIPGYNQLFLATLALLQERLVDHARLLIVGCGTGREIEIFAPAEPNWRFDAVDPSLKMVRCTEGVIQRLGVQDRVGLYHAYTHELDLPYKHDAATVINVMHFLPDDGEKDRLMRSVAERISPGGTVMLFDLHGDPAKPYFPLFYSAWVRFMDLRHYTGKKKERLLKRLAAGIAYVEEDRILEICDGAGLNLIRPYWGGLLYTGWLLERR